MKGVRVLVLGATERNKEQQVDDVLMALHREQGICTIITGNEDGAMMWARRFAHWQKIPLMILRPQGGKRRTEAYAERDRRLIDEGEPDLVVGFRCGSGAYRIIKRAEELGIPVLIHDEPTEEDNDRAP